VEGVAIVAVGAEVVLEACLAKVMAAVLMEVASPEERAVTVEVATSECNTYLPCTL
jgi:hypothetical protein